MDIKMTDGATLHIANIPFLVTEQELHEIFTDFSELVEIFIPREHGSGKHQGVAFAKFSDHESAKKAAAQINGTEHKGRQLKISVLSKKRCRGRW